MSSASCPYGADCQRLTVAQDDYNRLFDLSLDLLCIAGGDGFFKRVNPAWTQVLGWTAEELLSRPVASFMHPEDRERTLEARRQLLQGNPVRGLENRYLCKDGSHRWLSWQSSYAPATDLVFGVARDITERRKQEQERLVVSKLEATGILASGLAHDFNNLLASLLLNLEMVSLSAPTTREQEKYVRQARHSIGQAKLLTQQLITFAEGGVWGHQVCDLKELLQECAAAVQQNSSFTIACLLSADLWPAEIDRTHIQQLVQALLANACEASPVSGVVHLRAENVVLPAGARADLPAGDYVRVTVADDGVGIEPAILSKIFDPYFSTKTRGVQKGMGLGLTVCRSIVRHHGGAISVESQPGCGTTVVFHLPAAIDRRPGAAEVRAPVREPRRILVMDDEQTFRQVIVQTLGRLGYEAELANDGEDAIAIFVRGMATARRFDAVMLDLDVRHGMGGVETVRELRRRDPALRAVLLSGPRVSPPAGNIADLGFNGLLTKPFSTEDLHVVLTEIFRPADQGHGQGI